MALDIFLTIPGINGESVNQNFPKAIEVYSYSFGVSNVVSLGSGGGGGAGKPNFSDLAIQKNFDSASPLLFQACVSGKHLQSATLTLVKAGGSNNGQGNRPFLIYELTEVFVTSLSDGGSSGGNDVPSESLTFAFGKIEIKYTTQNPDGSMGQTIIAGWDVAHNTGP